MVKLGVHIIPDMPVKELIETIVTAEQLGYERCLVADEGFMPDVYTALSAAAMKTSVIHLGPVTNGYTRHPAVTATALATLNDISDGRVFVTLVAGGSMVLNPMGIKRESPLMVIRESIDIMRALWSGESVNYQGKCYQLNSAKISMGKQTIPIWIAGRGPKILGLTGEVADGALLLYKSDLGPALEIVEDGAKNRPDRLERIYLDRMAYNDVLWKQAAVLWSFVILDTPSRQLESMNISSEEGYKIRQSMSTGGPIEAAKLITVEMIKKMQIAGSMQECGHIARQLISTHEIDCFMLNLTSGGIQENLQLMKDTISILGKEVDV